jgi:hypothetical protein
MEKPGNILKINNLTFGGGEYFIFWLKSTNLLKIYNLAFSEPREKSF